MPRTGGTVDGFFFYPMPDAWNAPASLLVLLLFCLCKPFKELFPFADGSSFFGRKRMQRYALSDNYANFSATFYD
jgi:hypothetical protein